MNVDLSRMLDAWPFDQENNVRRIVGEDGREKIQIRVEQGPFRGLLQMDLEGRPDGTRPHNCDYALDYYEAQARRADGGSGEFALSRDDCQELFAESRSVYERYAFLLQICDYERVVRDTERNMRLFRFVNEHARHPDDRHYLERWWPYILRISATAKAMVAIGDGHPERAMSIIDTTRTRIDNLQEVDAAEFHVEKQRSIEALTELAGSLREQRPRTLREQLEAALGEAVRKEKFELAAELRDRLGALDG